MARALKTSEKRGVLISSGSLKQAFLDDHTYPFKVNPHFKAWLPVVDVPDSFLLIIPGSKPALFYNQPLDYWHKPPADPEGFWTQHWDIQTIRSTQEMHNLIGDTHDLTFIGEETQVATRVGIGSVNDKRILDALHFDRAYKTPYELGCLQRANDRAARGHLAARRAFSEGRSEFEIQQAFLAAIRGREKDAPYSGIIALNEHCAILHYQHYETRPPAEIRSMLIDAGATSNGYAADVTRTYAFRQGVFADLINALDIQQQAIIEDIQPGMNYIDLHRRMHLRLAEVLREFGLVDMSPSSMVESNLTSTFLPHGLGHLLGLQTHDVAGFVQNREGVILPAPDQFPALRLTRPIEESQVFTIEPGLYFIPMLLDELRSQSTASDVNWPKVDTLLPFGGIRIEDNIAIQNAAPINLTRQAFAKQDDE